MAQVLIRDVDPEVVEKLKARAKRNRRSLEAEMRVIVHAAAQEPEATTYDEVLRVRAMFAGRTFTDSTEIAREDRER